MNMTTKRPFAELLTGLSANKLSLTEVIQGLNERGAVQSPLHKAELAMLDEALAKNKVDEKMHRLLTGKLKEVQSARPSTTTAGSRPVASGDKTVVAGVPVVEKTASHQAYRPGADDKTAMNPHGADAKTVMNPAGGDRTTINPASIGGDHEQDPDKTAMAADGSGGGDGDGFDLLIDTGDDGEKTEMGDMAATTGFKPSEPATASRTGTGSKSGPNTSSWQRVAATGGPEREVHPGDVLKDRFYLDKELGRGGMGIVFKARDERKVEAQDKNPWVAVKVLNSEFRKHPQALVALQRESRKAQQLTHDNILRVYDFDKDGTVIYMTMEYVDGGSLKDVIKKHPNGMPWDKGWPIIAGLARGLGRAHRDNIVHSDFKPGNVMMTSDMIPKLFDMGIARAAKSGADSKGETTVFDAGELGALTPAYASLEMIQGQPPELIDDIYALGITAYEILTGKHPFNKKNAEQVMKEGLKPPVVPGLSRMQQRTLQAAVAFKREDRVKSCDAFLDGMRARTFKDYAPQAMGGVVAVVLLLVGIFGGLLPYLKGKRIDNMIAQFSQATFGEDTTAALAALQAMDAEERETAMNKGSTPIQDYFFKLANDRWDIGAKPPKYRYTDALAVLTSAKSLYPESLRVAQNIDKIDNEKNKELTRLREEYTQRVEAGLIYESKPGNVVETLQTVALIDPKSDLLQSKSLPQKYKTDVEKSLEAKEYERAATQVATATKAFPGNEDLRNLATQVKTFRETELAKAKERELREKMTAAQAKEELVKLAANPTFTPDWQVNVNVAMSKLVPDASPETQAMKEKLAAAYAEHVAKMTADKQLPTAQLIADAGMKLFPGTPALMKEVSKLGEARKVYEAEQAKVAALARVDDLKSGLIAQAKANEVQKATKALNELKLALAPTDAFLVNDAPKAIADAYLRLAEKQAAQNRFADARRFIAEGLKVAPALDELKTKDRQYLLDGSVAQLQAGVNQPANAKGDELKAALAIVRAQDPQRYAKLEGDLQNGVLGKLQAMTKTDPAAAGRGKAEWLKVFPQYEQLASLVIPEATAPVASTTTAAASTTPSLPREARAARPHGVETCLTSFSTYGRSGKASCQDDLGGGIAGPKMVVVPGPSGGFLAVTKYEITAGQFNAFCSETGKCRPQGSNEALPATGVSLALAKSYAAWLTQKTGFNYRLPTDAEWANAASAGGAGSGEDFQCIVNAGGSQIKGGNAIPVSTGKPNPWGLVNVIGNVAELTDGGSARGGHFNTPTSQCTVEWRQGGNESDTVGLRLVRDLG
jgi:non-specific serine/threonine protein kinase